MTDVVNVGTTDNDGNGDTLRSAFSQINTRFNELLSTIEGGDAWATGVTYTATPIRQWVIESGQAYVAAVNHVSGATFAADFADGKWFAVDTAQILADLAGTNGASLIGYTPTGLLTATTVEGALNEVRDASKVSYTPAGTGAVPTNVETVLRETIYVSRFGAPTNGTDATTEINAAILAAYKSKANVLSPTDEIYQVEVKFEAGKDYKVTGPIWLPSGIVLNGNGCRLVGDYGSAATTAYNDGLPSIIETATYDGSGFVSNRSATLATQRVVGGEIRNFTFQNANCAINAISMNEQCVIEHCQFSNVSAAMRLKWCFYLRVNQHIVRNSCQATGQYAILLHGGNHNAMSFTHVALANPRIGIVVSGPSSFGTTIKNCTFEEGKADSSTGLLFVSDAYCAGWDISNNYVEGVRYGISLDNGASIYGGVIDANIFNNNEYAIFCSGPNALRMTSIRGNSLPDDGGTIRNLIEFSNTGIDTVLQVPTKIGKTSTGPTAFLSNFSIGNAGRIEANSIWVNDASQLQSMGRSQPGLANQNKLNEFAFEGGQIVSATNQIPFATVTVAINTLTIDTSITYDTSNILAFNFYGNTDAIAYDLKGFLFGNAVSWVTHDPVGVTATVSNNGGFVRVVFGGVTAAVPVINTTGLIRHV